MKKFFDFVPLKVTRWDAVEDGCSSLTTAIEMHQIGWLPKVMEAGMIAVPAIRVLRGVYGSDEKAAKALLLRCLKHRFQRVFWAVSGFWRYRVLMRSSEREFNDFMAEEKR